jgi:pilus assembly protein CpaF
MLNVSLNAPLNSQMKKINNSISEKWNATPIFNEHEFNYEQDFHKLIHNLDENLSTNEKNRIFSEVEGLGPIQTLVLDEEISEIIINGPDEIIFEKQGQLYRHEDSFLNLHSFESFIHRISKAINNHVSLEKPFATGRFLNLRVQIVGSCLTQTFTALSFRRPQKQVLNLAKWASEEEVNFIKKIIEENKNFLIIGSTGSGKTTLLNSILNELAPTNVRSLLLEDVPELVKPNTASLNLYTREALGESIPAVTLGDLVRTSLRLRPDRIVMGEVRGGEAKDLLMALSTGHRGSFGSLHADHPQQALLRLEMLIQQGAPQWNLESIRRLISLSLDYLIAVEKDKSGKRKLSGIYKISSQESSGFLLDKVF